MKKTIFALIAGAVLAQAGFISDGMQAQDKGDHKKMVEIYQTACDQGKASGCYNLAVLYTEGTGNVQKDEQKALKLYEKACDANFASACYNLGVMYVSGTFVKQDLPKAASL